MIVQNVGAFILIITKSSCSFHYMVKYHSALKGVNYVSVNHSQYAFI